MKPKDKKYLLKKPLFIAGIAAIVLIFASLISNSLFYLSDSLVTGILYSLVVCFASIIFLYGFYVIGDRYNSKLLKVLAILGIIVVIVFYISSFVFGGSLNDKFAELNQTLGEYNQTLASINVSNNLTSAQIDNLTADISVKIFKSIAPFLLVFAVIFILGVVYSILCGVALIRLNEKVKYSRIAGILEIVGACTLIIGVGLFVMLAAFVFEVMILFDQAKKFGEY